MGYTRKSIRAGKLCVQILYPTPSKQDSRRARREKREFSTAARQFLNDRSSKQKLELLLASNFSAGDLFLTATFGGRYRRLGEPEKLKFFKRFLRNLRDRNSRRGVETPYVYAPHQADEHEPNVHVHAVVRLGALTLDELRALWKYGNLDIKFIGNGDFGDFEYIAAYLCHEYGQREKGKRLWVPSKGLKQPEIETEEVPAGTILTVPDGYSVLRRGGEDGIYSGWRYLKCIKNGWNKRKRE